MNTTNMDLMIYVAADMGTLALWLCRWMAVDLIAIENGTLLESLFDWKNDNLVN